MALDNSMNDIVRNSNEFLARSLVAAIEMSDDAEHMPVIENGISTGENRRGSSTRSLDFIPVSREHLLIRCAETAFGRFAENEGERFIDQSNEPPSVVPCFPD